MYKRFLLPTFVQIIIILCVTSMLAASQYKILCEHSEGLNEEVRYSEAEAVNFNSKSTESSNCDCHSPLQEEENSCCESVSAVALGAQLVKPKPVYELLLKFVYIAFSTNPLSVIKQNYSQKIIVFSDLKPPSIKFISTIRLLI